MSSTTTKPSTIPIPSDAKGSQIITVFLAAIVFVMHLAFKYSDQPVHPPNPEKYLTLAVESTAVRFYNATPDGRVCSIIEVGIRAGNKDPDGAPLNLTDLTLLVKKGEQTIADTRLPGVFNLTAGSEELVHGEAFGLVNGHLGKKTWLDVTASGLIAPADRRLGLRRSIVN